MKQLYSKRCWLAAWWLGLLLCSQVATAQKNRTITGEGNNLSHPYWGAAGSELARWVPAVYADSLRVPNGTDRPNPREVSNRIFHQAALMNDLTGLSDYCWAFGQFVDHDITHTGDGPELMFIPVPRSDPHFDPRRTGQQVIPMHRSDTVEHQDPTRPRQHPNSITAFVDASNVYGSTPAHARWLRTLRHGKLKMSSDGKLLPFNTVTGSRTTRVDRRAPHMDNPLPFFEKIFVAGDIRVNENTPLASLHTLFAREHNRLCDVIRSASPQLSDEEIYQRARKLNGAIMQSIVYNEWLPAMGIELPEYIGYKPEVNPSVANGFAAAAFRMGHTLLNGTIRRLNNDGEPIPEGHLSLRDAYFNPDMITDIENDIEPYLLGMAEQTQQSFDAHVIDDIRNFLFGQPGQGGLDLAAININRGRERGLGSYNDYRRALDLPAVRRWKEVVNDENLARELTALYPDPDNADVWVGMLAETRMPGKLFGPTVSAAMTRQFTALRDGDRYFYLNDPELNKEDCTVIEATRLSDVIKRNTSITNIQSNVFLSVPNEMVERCTSRVEEVNLDVSLRLYDGTPFSRGRVRLYGMNDYLPEAATNAKGEAKFFGIPTCDNYKIDAFTRVEQRAGLNVLDAVKIADHIVMSSPFTDVYEYLAADTDRNGRITGKDITTLIRTILGKETPAGHAGWRSINPATLPASIEQLQNAQIKDAVELKLLAEYQHPELVMINLGDVNNSYAKQLGGRSTLELEYSRSTRSEDRIEFAFSSPQVHAFQVELVFTAPVREVIGLDPGNYVLTQDDRHLRIVVNSSPEEGQQKFAVRLNGLEPEVIGIDREFEALAYESAERYGSIQLKKVKPAILQAEQPAQVVFRPNVVSTSTRLFVPASYAESGSLLIISNVEGKVVKKISLSERTYTFTAKELNLSVPGIYSWSLVREGTSVASGQLVRPE